MNDFILRALAAGLIIAFVAGPLGSFVVWRRMSYFGDTLAHSSLLGVAIGILLDINSQLAVIAGALVFADILVRLQSNKSLSTDTLLGILAHSTLAFGMLILSFSRNVQINIEGYLFGDLLTVTQVDIGLITLVALTIGFLLYSQWNKLLAITVHEELAHVEGIAVGKLHTVLVLLVALLIAVSMKIIGVLLITSLLIIPPATARRFSETPEQMAIGAALLGMVSVVAGLAISYFYDTPAGPSIVVAASMWFLVSYLWPGMKVSPR